jgi:chromosome segregation ATPase
VIAASEEGTMDTTTTEVGEPPLAKARRTLAEAERVVRDELTVLAAFHAKDRQLAQEAQRLQATMQQAERRKANVTAANMAIDTIRNQAAVFRQRIACDQVEVRQLEGDIARAEADIGGWRYGLAALHRRIEAASSQLRALGLDGKAGNH